METPPPNEAAVLSRLRGAYGPSARDRVGRWIFALFFLGFCAPLCWIFAAGQMPPPPGHLPTVLATWMLMPFSIALGLFALLVPHPTYFFTGDAVVARRGRKELWKAPLSEIARAERLDEKSNEQVLLLAAADGREWRLNLYPELRRAWRAALH